MKEMVYCVYREDEFFVAQCLNVDVSSFGATREEAVSNLKEAVELYFEREADTKAYTSVTDAGVGLIFGGEAVVSDLRPFLTSLASTNATQSQSQSQSRHC